MSKFPNMPFLTEDFSPEGGGIDYLGLRWVNLKMLGERLLPGINNVTADMGTFFLGTWIPWKFRQLYEENSDIFTSKNYIIFREKIEVLMSYVIRDDLSISSTLGSVRTKIGVEQKFSLESPLSFEGVQRSSNNTLFAAPLYGPSLKHLGFIAGYAKSEEGTATKIHLAFEDGDTKTIALAVNLALSDSGIFESLISLTPVNIGTIGDFCVPGLNPAFYRTVGKEFKKAFFNKLLPPLNPRTLTAQLIVSTLRQFGEMDSKSMRKVWHTGLNSNGNGSIQLDAPIAQHRVVWSAFIARQIQRYILETFFCCLERSIKHLGKKDIDTNVRWLLNNAYADDAPKSFREIIDAEFSLALADVVGPYQDLSKRWCNIVHANHTQYDHIMFGDDNENFQNALKSLARWWIRSTQYMLDTSLQDINSLGGTSRISAKALNEWINDRLDVPLEDFSKELLSGLIFTQHLRIAFSRMDGQAQRLRFTLGDEGIVSTPKAPNFGSTEPPWMADRLDAFLGLLEDLDVLQKTENNNYKLCENDYFTHI